MTTIFPSLVYGFGIRNCWVCGGMALKIVAFFCAVLTLRRTVVTVLPYGDVYETNGVRKMFGIPFVEVYTGVGERCLPHTKHQEGEKMLMIFFVLLYFFVDFSALALLLLKSSVHSALSCLAIWCCSLLLSFSFSSK